MSYNKDSIHSLVLETLQDYCLGLDRTLPLHLGEYFPLFGKDGHLNSIELVSFLALLEEEVCDLSQEAFEIDMEQAISYQESPFATVGGLIEYVCKSLLSLPATSK